MYLQDLKGPEKVLTEPQRAEKVLTESTSFPQSSSIQTNSDFW